MVLDCDVKATHGLQLGLHKRTLSQLQPWNQAAWNISYHLFTWHIYLKFCCPEILILRQQ
jgi:hypothetical protein